MTESHNTSDSVVTRTELAGIKLLNRGKVRDIYEVEGQILLISTDRISAFDCVLPNGIPNKGKVLNTLSEFWFDRMKGIIKNHIITTDPEKYPAVTEPYREMLRGRSMLVKAAKPYAIDCVVRGYLAGSGWRDYQRSQSVSGVALPAGLRNAEKLPEPIFTPSTKATDGHDEPITFDEACELAGRERMIEARERSHSATYSATMPSSVSPGSTGKPPCGSSSTQGQGRSSAA